MFFYILPTFVFVLYLSNSGWWFQYADSPFGYFTIIVVITSMVLALIAIGDAIAHGVAFFLPKKMVRTGAKKIVSFERRAMHGGKRNCEPHYFFCTEGDDGHLVPDILALSKTDVRFYETEATNGRVEIFDLMFARSVFHLIGSLRENERRYVFHLSRESLEKASQS